MQQCTKLASRDLRCTKQVMSYDDFAALASVSASSNYLMMPVSVQPLCPGQMAEENLNAGSLLQYLGLLKGVHS